MGWKDRASPVEVKKTSWKDRASPVEIAPEKYSQTESALRGAAQGASLGLEDELAGLGGVLGNELGKVGVDKVQATNPELQAKLDAIAGHQPSTGDVYRQSRDEERGKNLEAEQANPGSFFGGSLVGGVANPVARAAGSLKGALGLGAAQGLGSSNSDLTKGDIGEAALDTAIGIGAGGLGYGVGKAIPKMWEGVKYFGKKALTNFGPSGEAIEARLAGKAQDAAKSYPELAEDMGATLKDLGKQTGELDHQAWNTLSREADIPKAYVTSPIDETIEGLKLQGQHIGETDKQAAKRLMALRQDLSQLGDSISEHDLKGIVKKLDENINWDDQGADKLNSLLEGLRSKFDDALKFNNTHYQKAMEPVAERTALLHELKKKFNFKSVPGEGLQPTDATATNIQSSLRENKAVTQGNLGKLKEFSGKDYSDLANDYRLSKQFAEKSPLASTKKSFIGGAAGSLAAGPLGAGIGAAAGGTMDAYGGKVAAKLIDSYLKAGNTAAFGKFKPVIEKAAAQGPQALAIVSAILSDNPEFQTTIGNQGVRVRDPKGKVRLVPRYRVPAAIQAGGKVVE